MNLILPIFLIISSIGIFFGYVDPNYKGSGDTSVTANISATGTSEYSTHSILSLRDELATYENIASSSQKIISDRKILTDKNNKIKTVDKNRLTKFLPDKIDNIRLIIEISELARNRGLFAKNISVSESKKSTDSVDVNSSSYDTLLLRFSVNSTYDNFKLLLADLENNLRVIDITDISFSSTESGFYDFNVGLKTYWLK